MTFAEKHIDSANNMILYYRTTFLLVTLVGCFVDNELTDKLMHSSNHTAHYRIEMYTQKTRVYFSLIDL